MDINALDVIGALFGLLIYLLYAIYAYYKVKRRFDNKGINLASAVNETSLVNSAESGTLHPSITNNSFSIHNELFGNDQGDPIRALSDIYPVIHDRPFTVSAGSKFTNED